VIPSSPAGAAGPALRPGGCPRPAPDLGTGGL